MRCCKFKSKDFDTRISIESFTFAQNADGSDNSSWSTTTSAWAKIQNLRMRERFEAQQNQYKYTHKAFMRYNSTLAAITTGSRVVIGSRYFNILGVQDIDEQRKFIQMDLQESSEAAT